MKEALPEPLLRVDRELHAIQERIAFSKFLNPLNGPVARDAWRRGAHAPPFTYAPATWAEAELRVLDTLDLPLDHPFGPVLQRAVEGTRLFVLALRDRSPEAFDRLSRASGWIPDAALLRAAERERDERDGGSAHLGAAEVMAELRRSLQERGLLDWRVEEDTVMSARVLVDGAKRLLRINPLARFREVDLRRLVVHEVEVHAIRAANGFLQPLRIFSTGLPGALDTEEGLALVSEERAGVAIPGTAWRQGLVVRAVEWAQDMGFRELHDRIAAEGGPALAYGIAERLKRGLADPALPGAYAKDIVYYRGMRKVRAFLAAGRPVEWLYVGKVGVEDPVGEWLRLGLIQPQPLPPVWR